VPLNQWGEMEIHWSDAWFFYPISPVSSAISLNGTETLYSYSNPCIFVLLCLQELPSWWIQLEIKLYFPFPASQEGSPGYEST
jgi:hypothetical protein